MSLLICASLQALTQEKTPSPLNDGPCSLHLASSLGELQHHCQWQTATTAAHRPAPTHSMWHSKPGAKPESEGAARRQVYMCSCLRYVQQVPIRVPRVLTGAVLCRARCLLSPWMSMPAAPQTRCACQRHTTAKQPISMDVPRVDQEQPLQLTQSLTVKLLT
jgi:hypothetical protein